MPKFRVYNKIYKNGKPVGRAFVYDEVQAKSKEQAKRSVQRHNAIWNKIPKNKRQKVSAHVVKVVQLTKKGTIKGKKRRKRSAKSVWGLSW